MLEELTEEQREKLSHIAKQSAQVRDLLNHPGMAVVKQAIDHMAEFNKKKWYMASSPEEAEKIRLKTRGFEDFFKLCNAIITNGEAARKGLLPPSE